MSDSTSTMLVESLRRLLADKVRPDKVASLEPGNWHPELWDQMDALGMTSVALNYPDEGFGLVASMLSEVARSMAIVPILEHDVLAGWVLAQAGIDKPNKRLMSAIPIDTVDQFAIRRSHGEWLLTGVLPRVPFGRYLDDVVLVVSLDRGNWIVTVPVSLGRVVKEQNLANEPRDHLHFDAVSLDARGAAPLPSMVSPAQLRARGALGRCFQMIGAMERAFQMSQEYARTRVQFGRSLSQFQMIQNYVAEIASEIWASRAICELAVTAIDKEGRAEEVAAAKIRVGQAAKVVAERSHQIHGAIGVTQEYTLHLATRRLWSWREEFGNESFWADRLSESMRRIGADGLWDLVTR